MGDALRELTNRRLGGIPANASPMFGCNSTDVSDTTPQAVVAAPAAGLSHYITKLVIANKTASEAPTIVVQDGSGTPVVLCTVALANLGTTIIDFDPPIKATTAKAINAKALTSVGDTVVTAVGYTG